jgi:pimeloyl-ACP methyl ester carboxylesterase
VVPAAWIGHLELSWEDPAVRAFYAPLAARRTVVQYDKPGCGLSGPWPGRQSLDADLEVLEAVVDHLGLDRFDLLGISMGAPVAIALAARQPQRVGRLVLYGGYADGHQLAADEVRAAMVDLVRAHWGSAPTCWPTCSCPTAAPRCGRSSPGSSAARRRRRSPPTCWPTATSSASPSGWDRGALRRGACRADPPAARGHLRAQIAAWWARGARDAEPPE